MLFVLTQFRLSANYNVIGLDTFRLAEGHAKLMYRTKVEVIDAVTAAELVGTTILNNSDAGCPFPKDPIATYLLKGVYIKPFMKQYKYYI